MDTNSILLIVNLVLTTIVPIIANLLQTIIINCRIRRSSCCGNSIETYSPEIKKVNSENKINGS